MIRLLIVATICLSPVLTYADWAKPFTRAGFHGHLKSGAEFGLKVNSPVYVVDEIPFRPRPIPGWPALDFRFSETVLRMYTYSVDFTLVFADSTADGVVKFSANGRSLGRPAIVMTPATPAEFVLTAGKIIGAKQGVFKNFNHAPDLQCLSILEPTE